MTPQENRPSEVIYQIYPATFKDANDDGHGDLKGITEKLDYVKSLGVNAIWISPFFLHPKGPAGDGGYAISNYREIDPRFGTMEDFEQLLAAAKERGLKVYLKVYMDFVLCHTSNEHDWFDKSRHRAPGFENRYVWSDGRKDAAGRLILENGKPIPPNNWLSVFNDETGKSHSAWTFDDTRGQFYLHHFNDSQPALNLNDPAVQDASLAEMEFWLKKGVSGVRLDALPYANYDPQLRDNPWMDGKWPRPDNIERWGEQRFEHSMCQEQTYKELIPKIRALLDRYHATCIGEVIAGKMGGGGSLEEAAHYLDPNTGLHMAYTNDGFMRFWDKYPSAHDVREMIGASLKYSPDGGLCNNLGNHDFPRFTSRVMGGANLAFDDAISKQFMALAVTMPGSLCMYQGEELSLTQAQDSDLNGITHDLPGAGNRDRQRTPMPWVAHKHNGGFSESPTPYLLVPKSHLPLAVNIQQRQPNSMLNFFRRIMQQRAENPALQTGATELLKTWEHNEGNVVAFTRKAGAQTVLCTFNMSDRDVALTPSHYLDAATLQQLHFKADEVIHLGAYATSFHGLKPPAKGYETGLHPVEHYVGNGHSTHTHTPTIFAIDLLLADEHIHEQSVPQTLAAIQQADASIEPNDKATITKMFHTALQDEAHLAPDAKHITPGGSTASALATIKKLLGEDVVVNLMGLAADDIYGKVITDFLTDAGINMATPLWPDNVPAETAVSHIIEHPTGDKNVFTYPGTEVAALTKLLAQPDNRFLLEKNIRNSDIVFMPESITSKFGVPLRNQILESRWRNKKELVLALPTRADYGPEDSAFFKYLISSCNIVMGNDVEFCRILLGPNAARASGEWKRPVSEDNIHKVVAALQAEFKEEILAHAGMPCSEFGQVAFITRGNNRPALVVTKDRVSEVPVMRVERKKIRSELGAGHATLAGFLTGYMKGLPHEESAKLAVALAAEQVQQQDPAPYLIDPQASLQRALKRSGMGTIKQQFAAAPGRAVA